MLARVHTRQGCLACSIGPSAAPPPLAIQFAVGRQCINNANDVAGVQAALNRVLPPMGGPAKPLVVDGGCGPKTLAAIESFQLKHFGWKDGVMTPGGPTHTTLAKFASAFGPEAVAAPDPAREMQRNARLARAHLAMPQLRQIAMAAIATASAATVFVDHGFLAHIDDLGPRNGYRIADRYFAFGDQPPATTRAELQFILTMCRRVASAIAVRLGEIHGIPLGLPLFAVDRTDASFFAYTPRRSQPATPEFNAGHIYLCDKLDNEADERYLRILSHEMFHFVDDEATHDIGDFGHVGDALDLPHAQRMHNADNFALFAMHAHTGRPQSPF